MVPAGGMLGALRPSAGTCGSDVVLRTFNVTAMRDTWRSATTGPSARPASGALLMNHATSAAAAAALLLQPGTGGPDAVAGTTRQLRLALDAHLLVQVDGWLADGPDAEQ